MILLLVIAKLFPISHYNSEEYIKLVYKVHMFIDIQLIYLHMEQSPAG